MRAVSELQDKMNHNSMTYTERKTECLQLVKLWTDSMILKCNEEL
jgi:hypothetical protein